jgi:signal transduction histidine kinase/ActR/RegA family two-component response regulator
MLLNARQIERESGKERIILLAIEDITEKKKLEREVLTAKDVAEVATRVKSDFLANMSHELRTPLNSIIGFSEVLEDELLGALNPSQREDVQYIHKAGKHLLSLINDILDLAKVESGKMQLEVGRVSLKGLLESMLAMHREKASRRGVSIDLQMETVADMTIETDERKLKQILFNLLSNAVKFTPDGGSVRILARMLPGAKEIEISVEDTGIGIKPEDIQKLFMEFSQLDSVYDKEYGGTGLGLALTKKLVEMQGGRIRVVSEFGKGSIFTFVLPVKQGRKKMAEKILVIEDNEQNRLLMRQILVRQGYDLLEARDGLTGIEMARAHMPALILLDIQMPVMNGFMVIRELQNDVELRKIKVIAVTSFAMKGDREKALQAGFDEYVTKPIDTRTFPELVKQVLTEVQP